MNMKLKTGTKVMWVLVSLLDTAHFPVSRVEMLIWRQEIIRSSYCGIHFPKYFLDRLAVLCVCAFSPFFFLPAWLDLANQK